MRSQKLFIWILLPWLTLTVIGISLFLAVTTGNFKEFLYDKVDQELRHHAEFLESQYRHSDKDRVSALFQEYSRQIGVRITLIDTSGRVIYDSHENIQNMDYHGDRPEVSTALTRGIPGSNIRYSYTLDRNMMYLARPVLSDSSEVRKVIRVAMPLQSLENHITFYRKQLLYSAGLFFLLLIILAYFISRAVSKPLEDMRDGAETIVNGNYDLQLKPRGALEMRNLAESFNRMSGSVRDYIARLTERGNDLNMLLSSMKEGVIAIDKKDRILWINAVAALTFNLDRNKVIGDHLFSHLRDPDVQEFVRNARSSGSYQDEKITFSGIPDSLFIISAAPVIDADNRRVGLILVIRDITRLEKLESVRKDFVANVSHELKTPITTVQGYTEALIENNVDAETRSAFLETILKNAKRMNSIINDLIDLARLEREGDTQLERQTVNVSDLLTALTDDHRSRARSKNITIALQCGGAALTAPLNAPLIEQALGNLVDNAVKYSGEGSTVTVSCEKIDNELIITVADQGMGIPAESIPRIFERFYRVDKARSRKEGGTGLGLSICKHIIQAHQGRIEVDSTPGRGSTFRITLPL